MHEGTSPRRCVLVAPFYPPSALPPAHRARLFVRHLPAFGWTPIVVTVDPRDREEPPDHALEGTLPAGIRTERVRALPARLTRIFGIGDLALRALPSLAWRAVRVAREARGTVVLLIVPPWYALWLAPLIAWVGNAAVVVDYIDPWRIQRTGTLKSRLAAWIAAHTESLGLRGVSGVFAVAPQIVADVQGRRTALRAAPAAAAPYGFEPTDWALSAARPGAESEASAARPLRLVYVGAISDAQMPVLAALLDALTALGHTAGGRGAQIRLELYGTTYAAAALATPRAAALIRERGLEGCVVEQPLRVAYGEALRLMATADVNVVLGDTTPYYAASKLMPVLSARRPVLAVVHDDTEPATLLRQLNARGLVCYGGTAAPSPSAAVSAIARKLIDLLDQQIPVLTCDLVSDADLARRSAKHMTGELAGLLDRVVAARGVAA
jgi:hypothetical protein